MHRCYNCAYLCSDKKVDGKVDGALYYCKKMNKFINPINEACQDYEKTWTRKSSVSDEMYENGKKYDDEPAEPGKAICYLIIILLLTLIVIIFA